MESALPANQQDLTIRPITGPDELALFCRLPYVLNDELADDLDAGRRRPDWMWVALRGDRVMARVAWWGQRDAHAPQLLDVFDIDDEFQDPDRLEVGVRLLRTATAQVIPPGTPTPEYCRFIPSDWRDSAAARRVVEDRMAALEQTGARLFVERLRLEWRSGTPVPEPTGRLVFRHVRDRDELVRLMTLVLQGTLDAHSRDDLSRMPADKAAAAHYDRELAHYRSPQDWWRVATLPDGEPVGFVTPARNEYNPIIGYVGVLPAHRGNGYVDDILAEGTRILATANVPRIRAATDLGNTPMAMAFERAGYVNYERAINMTWTDVRGE
jgi:RimJ/RimL family protein N-acetyltransferase